LKGYIVINAYPKAEKFLRQAERIKEELVALGAQAEVIRNGSFSAWLEGDGKACVNLQDCDFVVYLDKDKYAGRILEQQRIRLFNRASAVEICDDKTLTSLALNDAGVRLPRTVSAPLCYTQNAFPDEVFLKNVETLLGFPMVAKTCYGSFGEGVALVQNFSELLEREKKWLYTPHLYQEYIEQSKGRDLRVIVVGGKAIGAMRRTAKAGEFRSNIELGGIGEKAELSENYKTAAERAAVALGLDYCGVDLLETQDGPILCEVNSNAFFEGFESATGINVAKAYAEHIVKTMKSGRF